MKKVFTLIVCAVAILSAAAQPVGIANVIGAKSWEEMSVPPYGMYSFTLGDTPNVKLVAPNVVPANFGAVYVDGKYFVIEGVATAASSFITNYVYKAETWEKITDFRGENITAFDMTWDAVSDNVYGYFHNFDTEEEFFGTIDINTGATKSIAALPFVAYGLSADVEGNIYAISKEGDLYSLDKLNGRATKIASTGCSSKWTTSGAIDSSTSTFYYVCCNDTESVLYAINIHSGAATRLQTIPDEMEIAGLYFPEETALPGAPSKATNLSVDFPEGNLAGEIRFTIPEKLSNGDSAPAGATANYSVAIDDNVIAEAQGQYGSTVAVPASIEETGEHTITVALSNAVGSAPIARTSVWLGHDVPAQVEKVDITYDGNGTFTLSWTPTKPLHGGWYDPATVSYTVSRYSLDSTDPVVYTGITETTFENSVPLPPTDEYATYHYNVTPLFGSVAGSTKSSEFYTIGSLTPPFKEEFNARYDLGKFTIFEGEFKDNNRWAYDNKAVTLTTFGASQSDDYLVLPPLMLDSRLTYDISFLAKGKYESDTETFEVLAGLAPTVEALNELIMETVDMKSTTYQEYKTEFHPSASGAYFIAIHGTSAPYLGAITIDDIFVSGGYSAVDTLFNQDCDLPTLYYTLQGIPVANPHGGIFIERRGTNTRKIYIP